MRLLLYEWCCSGGMQSDFARDILQKAPLEDFLKEGRLMLEALACDAEKNADLNITVMVDATLSATEAPHFSEHITIEKVPPGKNCSSLLAVASESDHIILIAPETQGILLDSLIAVEQAGLGDRLVNCPVAFIRAASDKQTTCAMLAAAGIPTPAGCTLPSGGSIPTGFRIPAVLKARESAGCDGLRIIQNRSDFVTPEIDSRLECHFSGIPAASVVSVELIQSFHYSHSNKCSLTHSSRCTSAVALLTKIIMLECSLLQYGRSKLSTKQRRLQPVAGSELI